MTRDLGKDGGKFLHPPLTNNAERTLYNFINFMFSKFYIFLYFIFFYILHFLYFTYFYILHFFIPFELLHIILRFKF